MDLIQFRQKLAEYPHLRIAGAIIDERRPFTEDKVVVENTGTGAQYAIEVGPCLPKILQYGRVAFRIEGPITIATLECGNNWGQFIDVVEGRREPGVLSYVARIVGYFSHVQIRGRVGWNRSKIAELADRHNGDYGVGTMDSAPTRMEAACPGQTS